MASASEFARVGLISVVAAILGVNTLTSLLPSSDVKAPSIDGPPLYQAAALPFRADRDVARIPAADARLQPAKATSTAVALLEFPQTQPAADKSTTGLAPIETPAPPVVAEAESPPKPEKRAAARAKQVRWARGSLPPASASPKPPKQGRTQPPIYTRDVQMSMY